MTDKYTCAVCKTQTDSDETYEYRGFYSCSECFSSLIEKVDYRRQEIIEESYFKTRPLKGLDLNQDSIIGKANLELLKQKIEVCSKETFREKEFRNGKL